MNRVLPTGCDVAGQIPVPLGIAGHVHLDTKKRQTNFSDGDRLDEFVLPLDPDENFRIPIVSLNTGVGFDHKWNERWSFRVEPYFQFFLQGNLKADFDQANRNYYQLGSHFMLRRSF